MIKNKRLLFPLFWIALWLLPWGGFVSAISPAVSLALTLILFIAPGYCASAWLIGDRARRPMQVLIGFAISNLVVALLGIAARLLHMPFGFIPAVFGMIGFAVIVLSVKDRGAEMFRPPALDPTPALIIFLIASIFTISAALFADAGDTFIVSDDASYLAYITNWQNSARLDYTEVIYGSGSTDSIRFWLSYFPMTLALLANLSGVPGVLLIGMYLEPLFLILALLAAYELGIALGLPPSRSAAALLLMLVFYFYMVTLSQPGSAFYKRLSEDKVFATYVLAPAFVNVFLIHQNDPRRRSAILLLLIGFSLVLTHPIVFFYAALVIGICAALSAWFSKQWKPLIMIALMLIVIALPIASLRFVDHPSNRYAFDAQTAFDQRSTKGLVSVLDDTAFYGFNPAIMKINSALSTGNDLLDMIFAWSFAWMLIGAGLWSLFHLRRSELARYIFACALLAALTVIPYTGWFIGFFVSARMLWRSIWFFPIGMASIALIDSFADAIAARITIDSDSIQARWNRFLLAGALIVSAALIIPSAIQDKSWLTISAVIRKTQLLSDLAQVGSYLENLPAPVIVAGQGPLNSSVPGLSSRSKALVFRSEGALSFNYFLSEAEWKARDAALTAIFSEETSSADRKRLMTEYDIAYLLLLRRDDLFKNDLGYNVASFGSLLLVNYAP